MAGSPGGEGFDRLSGQVAGRVPRPEGFSRPKGFPRPKGVLFTKLAQQTAPLGFFRHPRMACPKGYHTFGRVQP
ncbi:MULTISPECIES: hypothetical protein, partial [unclassified Saccharothrix]|uniref:hypothetical protein n=1 Tax=unclassified Saccharothrix TaxID=2593673 RepID=UPI00307E8997